MNSPVISVCTGTSRGLMQFHVWVFFPSSPFPVLWGLGCSLELAMEVGGYPSTPPWSLQSSSGFASKASIFGDILEIIYITSVLLLNLSQKVFFLDLQEPGGWGLLFVWGGFLQQPCAREVFICAEGGEGNQRICSNPAATQMYACGLHSGAQLWLYLGHSPFPIKTSNVPSILLAFLAGSSESSLRCSQKIELGRGMTCFEGIIKLLLTLPHLLQKLLFPWGKKCFLGLWIICSNDIRKT